jgi:hypothetical protein
MILGLNSKTFEVNFDDVHDFEVKFEKIKDFKGSDDIQ